MNYNVPPIKLFFSICLLSSTCQLLAQSAPEQAIVKIAHIGPISNRYMRDLGVEGENVASMAAEELNAQNIVINGKQVVFQIVNFDDAARPDTAISVAKRACQSGAAGVIGHFNSGPSIRAAPVYNDCKLPHISVAATNPKLTQLGYQTTFRLIGNDEVLGQKAAKFASTELKAKRFAVIHDQSPYGEIITSSFLQAIRALGGEVVLTDSTPETSPALTSLVEKIKASNADLVVFGGMDGLAGKILKEMEYQKISNVKFMGGDGICSDDLPKFAGGTEAINPVFCAEAGVPIKKLPNASALRDGYANKYSKPIKGYGAQTYDAMFAFAKAMQAANSTQPQEYLPFLQRIHFDGVSGEIAFTAQGDLINPDFTFYTYTDGKKVIFSSP